MHFSWYPKKHSQYPIPPHDKFGTEISGKEVPVHMAHTRMPKNQPKSHDPGEYNPKGSHPSPLYPCRQSRDKDSRPLLFSQIPSNVQQPLFPFLSSIPICGDNPHLPMLIVSHISQPGNSSPDNKRKRKLPLQSRYNQKQNRYEPVATLYTTHRYVDYRYPFPLYSKCVIYPKNLFRPQCYYSFS